MGRDEACARLASRQSGVIGRVQALGCGMSEDAIFRRLRARRWRTLLPGVYAVNVTPASWQQRLTAAYLWAGPEAVVSHRSAAVVWGFDGFRRGTNGATRDPVDLSVYRNLDPLPPGIVVHRVRSLRPGEIALVSGFRVTTPTRTLIDLAAHVPQEVLETALDDALRRGLTSLPKLRAAARMPRRGVALVKALPEERTPGRVAASVLERRLLGLLLRAGLPKPHLQFEVRDGSTLIARLDLGYPDSKLAIEADGYAFHSGRSRWQTDRGRDNELVRRGWRVLHFTKVQIDSQPDAVAAQVGEVLRQTRVQR